LPKIIAQVKQLFCYCLLWALALVDKEGIHTKKLTGESLWAGMSPRHAKNYRGNQLPELKSHICPLPSGWIWGIRDKHWYLEIGEDCFCDYSRGTSINLNLGLSRK